MSENKLLELSFKFAVAIVNLVDGVTVPKSSYMTDQIARAGTSVGANIHEAQYAQSKKDFITGFLLFVLPLTFRFADIKLVAVPVCVFAAVSAAHEFYCVLTGRTD